MAGRVVGGMSRKEVCGAASNDATTCKKLQSVHSQYSVGDTKIAIGRDLPTTTISRRSPAADIFLIGAIFGAKDLIEATLWVNVVEGQSAEPGLAEGSKSTSLPMGHIR